MVVDHHRCMLGLAHAVATTHASGILDLALAFSFMVMSGRMRPHKRQIVGQLSIREEH